MSCKSAETPRPRGAADAVEANRYRADLELIASPRPPGSAHWQATQDRCAGALAAAGLTVTRQSYPGGVNVIGRLDGTSAPDEIVLVGAHYDGVPGCPGADDNASGVAGVLEVARALAGRTYRRTLLVACWDQEETGLRGSRAFADTFVETFAGRPAGTRRPGARLVGHFNFEMIAFASSAPRSQAIAPGFAQLFPAQVAAIEANERRGDFIAVVADAASSRAAALFGAHAARLGLPFQRLDVPDVLRTSPLLGDLRRSDHASFWDRGLPGIMLTDSADFRNANYHCQGGSDTVATLDLGFAVKVVKATAAAVADLLAE